MAFRPAPQGNPHGLSRVRAVGSPFEVSNNSSQVPQTLNYVDCYPMKEEQFGENPLYAVTCREAFTAISGMSFDFSSITITGSGGTGSPPSNTPTPPASLSNYVVSQIGQLLVVDDASTQTGGTTLFCNVVLQYNGTAPNSTNQFVVVSCNITISGVGGTTVSVTPTFLFFDTGPTLGVTCIANNSITGVNGAYIDPYYLVYSSPPALALTISANTASYNIYTAAIGAGMTTARSITVTINSGVKVGSLSTGSGFQPGTTINIVNNGTILGNGGSGGIGGGYTPSTPFGQNGSAGSKGTPAIILNWPVSLTNTSGTIAGGGGGGGGGAPAPTAAGSHPYIFGGGGGGSGQGYNTIVGALGGASSWGGGGHSGNSGGSGTLTTSGAGGTGDPGGPTTAGGTAVNGYNVTGHVGVSTSTLYTSTGGGSGGGFGAAGGTGGNQTAHFYTGGTGGAAGNAIQCNGYSILNVPNGTYTGTSAYGLIYGVIG